MNITETLNATPYLPAGYVRYVVSPWYIVATFLVVFVVVFGIWRFTIWPAIQMRRKSNPHTFDNDTPVGRQ